MTNPTTITAPEGLPFIEIVREFRSNTASRALFASQGFEYLGVEGDHENWVGTTG